MDSIITIASFLIVGVLICGVPFIFITSIFAKDNKVDNAEPWMYIVSGLITLSIFFFAFF